MDLGSDRSTNKRMSVSSQNCWRKQNAIRVSRTGSVGLAILTICVGGFSLSGNEVNLSEVVKVPTAEIQDYHDPMGMRATDFSRPQGPFQDDSLMVEESIDLHAENSILENDARLKVRLDNAIQAQDEPELVKFLDMEIGSTYKRRLLLTLGQIYELQNSPSREIALYEKFVTEFPNDHEVPILFLKLGCLYRDNGATKTALVKFYNVLNAALNVPLSELNEYQELSHRAQLEIAETYFSTGIYDQAAKYFGRLLRIDLDDKDRQNVFFKYAYTVFLAKDYKEAVTILRSYLNEYPDSKLTPETRYLLSEAYVRLNDARTAMRETLALLNAESTKIDSDPETWLYWKKRTGNKLANQFYQEGNYVDSITIYQAMIGLGDDPVWNWPVLYQVGLCYEKLDMKPKAMECFRKIVDDDKELSGQSDDDATLVSIREMAQWRIDRLEVELNVDSDLKRILENG